MQFACHTRNQNMTDSPLAQQSKRRKLNDDEEEEEEEQIDDQHDSYFTESTIIKPFPDASKCKNMYQHFDDIVANSNPIYILIH